MASRVMVLHPYTRGEPNLRAPEACLEEAMGLARAIDLKIQHAEIINLPKINAATYFGTGTVERLAQSVHENAVELAFVDTALSPGQQRNLENELKCKVIDRTGMILEIFGARARTHEGRLQVEMAALTYQKTRLVRSWTHLERQRGGHGFMGGPGERQIELDKRMIQNRITQIQKDLDKVKSTRSQQRKNRRKTDYPTIALVGYTNAGKSTLFRYLTGDPNIRGENQLFATLDPTMRGFHLPSGRDAILSDTVGFIADLPTDLVESFHATLEEVVEADIILHVRDITHPDTAAQKHDVEHVLEALNITPKTKPIIEVWNKIDQFSLIEYNPDRQNQPIVGISALTGENCDKLGDLIEQTLHQNELHLALKIPHSQGGATSWLYEHAQIIHRTDTQTHIELELYISNARHEQFKNKFKFD